MGYFPEILVPIVIFFGLSVFLSSSISAVGLKGVKRED